MGGCIFFFLFPFWCCKRVVFHLCCLLFFAESPLLHFVAVLEWGGGGRGGEEGEEGEGQEGRRVDTSRREEGGHSVMQRADEGFFFSLFFKKKP